jgi:hypothetical protein
MILAKGLPRAGAPTRRTTYGTPARHLSVSAGVNVVLFPVFLVPFSIILHIITVRVLLANRRRARDEQTSVATSAMTASGSEPAYQDHRSGGYYGG